MYSSFQCLPTFLVVVFFLFSFQSLVFVLCDIPSEGTVYYSAAENTYTFTGNVIDCQHGLSCGYFNDTLNKTGWSVLEIKTDAQTSSDVTDVHRMYAAGMLEGYLTAYEISLSWRTIWANRAPTYAKYEADINQWNADQQQWIDAQVAQHAHNRSDPEYAYWQYTNLLQTQLAGLLYGYNAAATVYGLPALDSFAITYLSALEEYGDLLKIFNPSEFNSANYSAMSDAQFMAEKLRNGSCSAMVKVLPELNDIYFSHSTWTSFYRMNRVYKQYLFGLELKTASSHLSMSSSPASLSSIDDYYQMNSGLASMETTNGVYNKSLFSPTNINPQSLFVWQRVRIANALATNGKEWTDLFAKYNSGTYNNQWMVLDYKAFVPNQPLPDGLLWILEQLPGATAAEDVTAVLERGYWPSYNVAAIESIYIASGTAAQAATHGPSASYDLAPRARIFRRDANTVGALSDAQRLMRYNNYAHDAIENNNPAWAIMARDDLETSNARCAGGIDTKIANFEMLQNMQTLALNGPTSGDVPVFDWRNTSCQSCADTPRWGLPLQYNFLWQAMKSVL